MKKRIVGGITALTIALSSVVWAASYPYGDNGYGEKNIVFQGNLNASGLGVDSRSSVANRHDLKLHNVNNGVDTPSSGFLQTVQYDIQPNVNEPPDKFSKISGYHVIPLEKEQIKDLAKKSNGNPDYVWAQISEKAQQAQNSSSKFADPVYIYLVDNKPYVNLGAVVYFSGGGDPDMVEAGGDGVHSPIFRSTYKTTNWPVITEMKQEGQGIKITASGSSIFHTSVTGKITVNGDSTTTKQVFTKSSLVKNYTVTYSDVIPFSQLVGLKEGENTVTLKVGDTFGRTAPDKTITVYVEKVPDLTNLPLFVNYTKQDVSLNLPVGASGKTYSFGGEIIWGLTYNKDSQVVLENTQQINDESYGDSPSQKIWGAAIAHWKYEAKYTGKGWAVKNTSPSENRPLVFYVGKTKYSLNKGQTTTVNVTEGDMHFASPLDVSGFFNNAETQWSGYKATKKYPPEIKDQIIKLVQRGNGK